MTSAVETTAQPQHQRGRATTTTARATTTFLRVKRPRHLDPLATLHLDLSSQNKHKRSRKSSNDEIEDLSQLMRQSTYVSAMQQQRTAAKQPKASPPSTVVWKRVSSDRADTKYSNHHKNNATHKRIRYVDARLDDDIEEEGGGRSTRRVTNSSNYHGDGGLVAPTAKRRRLALTLLQPEESSTNTTANSQQPSSSSTSNKKRTPLASPTKQNAILDPLSRLVDDSLQSVISGNKLLATHLDFIMTDSRFESSHQQSQTKWLCWSTKRMKNGGGTVLHAAALYNDLPSTTRILSMTSAMTPQSSCSSTSALQVLLTETDTDGRTPYTIAKLIGHDGIVIALEAFGAKYYEDQEELRKKKEKEEGDFVYDVFCLQEEEHVLEGHQNANTTTAKDDIRNNNSITQSTCSTPDAHNSKSAESICTSKARHPASTNNDNRNPKVANVPEVVELRGGIGYWDEHGELVLEAVGGGFESDDSVAENLDDDIDSNCEDHDGNDYPDEDEEFSDTDDWGGGIIRDEDDDDDSSNDANEYRHRPVYMNGGTSNSSLRNITTAMGEGGLGALGAGSSRISSMYSNTAATVVDDDDDYYNNSYTEYDFNENENDNARMYAYDPELDDGNYSS